ncbi:MAG: hypothetical protein LBD32_02015, partial [Cytophagales bacterium]|nr:hypothetical protein [Cytophagales bacterium]
MIKYFLPSLNFGVRLFLCSITSLILTFYLCKFIISFCNKKNMVDEIRDLDLEYQGNKSVPSFGGVAIILSTLIATILFANLKNIYVQLLLLSMILTGGIGFWDDYLKIFKRSKQGVKPMIKLLAQSFLGILICFNTFENKNICVSVPENYKIYSLQEEYDSFPKIATRIPFFKKKVLDYDTSKILGWAAFLVYAFFLTFIIAGTSNAVNLTDGVDGLALKNSL